MIRVSNHNCVRLLARRSLAASRTRKLVAVSAIALTTILFTALFTIAMSINTAFQEANFRQVGGFSHGGFKYMTQEQFEELKSDSRIREYGLRRFLGMPTGTPFQKNHVEISYCDSKSAHWMYCDPMEGRLPREGTDEAATDLEVLKLLGVTPRLGQRFTLTFPVDGVETTQTFTLCGWWEKDEIVVANHVLIPESRVDAVLSELSIPVPASDGMTGSYHMDVMFAGSGRIEKNLNAILADHGYQSERRDADLPYIATGVNWGYTGAQLADSIDLPTASAISAVLLLIIFTGYLIIYNVFQISVVSDIRFYGLLKTIGTTGRQIKGLIRTQAALLSLAGIPLGLFLGWLIGARLTPVVLNRLDGVMMDVVSVHPFIFLFSAVFALVTVLLSTSRPGRLAARISPVEAVRYTEGGQGGKNAVRCRKSSGPSRTGKGAAAVSGGKGSAAVQRPGGSEKRTAPSSKKGFLFRMAAANMGRSRSKTVVTILSLSLAIVLLHTTVLFTGGFDMDKYLAANSVSDFIAANAAYFQTGVLSLFSEENAMPPEYLETIQAQDGIREGGLVYGQTGSVLEYITEDYFRHVQGKWSDAKTVERLVENASRNEAGLIEDDAQLLGMEAYALDRLNVLEGDLSRLYEPGSHAVAAVYSSDDYGVPDMASHWAKVGDRITLRHVEEWEYYDPQTGKIYPDAEAAEGQPYVARPLKYRDVEYEVAALVDVPSPLSYRYYGTDQFVLNDQTFIQDTKTRNVMLYAFDTEEATNGEMEAFLADYTANTDPGCNYESKATYQAEFESLRSMFLMLGGALSFIVGLIGILNFFNAILTGIITRKREFAMLQSIGMTGKQLKRMLVYEGLLYALGSVVCSLLLTLLTGPLASRALGSMFWFFTYRLTVGPILLTAPVFALLGWAVPLAVYRSVSKLTIVERLREAEG